MRRADTVAPTTHRPERFATLLRALIREPWILVSDWFERAILDYPNTSLGVALRRWYLSRRLALIGSGFRMMRGCRIIGYQLLEIGAGSGLGDECTIELGPGGAKLIIGKVTFIGPGCYFRNMNHRFDDLDRPILEQGHEGQDIVIGDGVWIGARCILLAGARIGDHCVLAAGSVVSFDIPPYSVAGGNPARVIRRRVR
jgi:acetyltransferase-like isoleucine patch superfamily enzyme